MIIEIHNENTNETGTYKIWIKHNGTTQVIRASEAFTNSLLNMRQKEDFFMGKYRFKITSPYDQKLLLNCDIYKVNKHSAES